MTGQEPEVTGVTEDVTEGRDGDMGVSSERVGPTGPGQVGSNGVRDTSPAEPEGDPLPEQSAGGVEVNPDPPVPPVAGYNSHDPRSAEHPYEP